jgi:adenosylmethionine-8-amino-7-oxononanoate aminotransferase
LICVNLGYGQQEIVDAAMEQMRKLPYNATFWGHSNRAVIDCSKKLSELTPEGLDHFHFTSGGSDSNEVAYRLARLFWAHQGTQKHKIISLYDSYHGIHFGSVSASGLGRGFFARGVGPVTPGFLRIPNYHCYRCMLGLTYPACRIQCARMLEVPMENEGADSVAAFIAEPEHGTAGMIAPPPEYWPMVREICNKYDVLLIVDEVMTGFGRTGKMFAVEHWDIVPDMMTMAKGITGSYLPLGAVAIHQKVHHGLKGGLFGSYTNSGHPVCAAAAVKAMEIYIRDRVVENAAEMGRYAMDRLRREFEPLPCVGDIGGLGLMIGIEIVSDKESRKPMDPEVVLQAQKEAFHAGLFIRAQTTRIAPGNRFFFSPPLIINRQQIDRTLDILFPIVSNLKPA